MDQTHTYVAEKGVTALFEGMMADLLSEKPDDPVKYLIQHLTNKTQEKDGTGEDSEGFKQPVIFVLGGPGSGKGTQCGCIVRDFGYTHFSAGDLLREEVKAGSPRGQQIKEAMEKGELVPSEWSIGLLKNAIEKVPDATGFLIDGFPRNKDQGPIFEKMVRPCDLMLVFECSEEIMTKRILDRAATSGRVDDNIETLKKRFASNKKDTLPVIEHYESLGKVAKINSERSVEDVHADITRVLKEHFSRQ